MSPLDRKSFMTGNRFIIRMTIVVGLALATASPTTGDSIRLWASVRLPAGADAVRLADVAELEGAEAEQYADLVIAELTDDRLLEIDIRQVRQKLEEAGVHWGRVNLSGRAVVVRPHRTAAAPAAMTAASLTAGRADDDRPSRSAALDLVAANIIEEPTVGGVIAQYMARGLDIDPQDLRIIFDGADQDLLEQSSQTYRIELKPESSLSSDRVTFTVRLWSDGVVASSGQISLRPMVCARTAVLGRDVERGEPIGERDFTVTRQWLPPLQAALTCDPVGAVGRLACKRLKAGETLRDKNVRRPTIIERGDRVMVRCLVGGVVISLQAEACGDGAAGEAIEFRKLGERDTFLARVTGPGEAVLDVSHRRRGDPSSPPGPPMSKENAP
jgi:flagella basal body P-ring formation protein FlgA